MITLYQAYAAGFWTNLYRTPQLAAVACKRQVPEARQCIVYSGLYAPEHVDTALAHDFMDQQCFLYPTAIYLSRKIPS